MSEPCKVNSNCKDTLLDAAEAIACEHGSARLTLDAVAQRAGVSKGGLLYHFPNKDSLLTAMIERTFRRFDKAFEDAVARLPEGPGRELEAEITSQFEAHESNKRIGSTLLAVMANQPELMGPFRDEFLPKFRNLIGEGADADRIAILLYASYGICLLELLKLSPLEPERRQQVIDELVRQARAISGPKGQPPCSE